MIALVLVKRAEYEELAKRGLRDIRNYHPLALEEKHRADAPDRQSDRHCEARRYALDGAAGLVRDTDHIVAEGLDCAKTLVDDVGCKVDNAGRGMFYVSSDGPKPV